MGREGHIVPMETPTLTPTPAQSGHNKKKGSDSRKWILIDSSGRSSTLDNVDKYAILHRVHIHARDLRILDPLLSYPSTILGRERAIVLNLEHIKAIITADEVLLRDPSDENIIPVVEELQRRLPALTQNQGCVKESNGHDGEAGEEDESPFEFRALEVALEAICSFLAARTTELEAAAYPALDELTSKISSRNLDRVRKLKSAMTRLTARVQKGSLVALASGMEHYNSYDELKCRLRHGISILNTLQPYWFLKVALQLRVRDELEQLLDDDDDMADLYLSRKLVGCASPTSASGAANWFPNSPTIGSRIARGSRASMGTTKDDNDVEELEMLLEAYFMQIDSVLNKLTTLREYIDDTEDYINIQLDNHRNQLIQLELFLSSGTVCISIYALVTGIFGMNIPYTWMDNHNFMFKWVVIGSGVFCAVLFVLIMSYARYKGLVGS